MIDRSYWSAITDLINVGSDAIFKYLEHKSDVVREALKPLIEPP